MPFTAPARCRQVLDPAVADTVTSVLEGVLTNGTGYPNAATIGRPAAGKTGTNEAFSTRRLAMLVRQRSPC